jgi:hypothetical protein
MGSIVAYLKSTVKFQWFNSTTTKFNHLKKTSMSNKKNQDKNNLNYNNKLELKIILKRKIRKS